jgi:hypothetical protein
VPFGLVPLNTDRAEPPDGAGAGAGKASLDASKFVGLKVPLEICVASGRDDAASSSSVRFTPEMLTLPPTSDRIIAFCPPGPTSKMSTSSGFA